MSKKLLIQELSFAAVDIQMGIVRDIGRKETHQLYELKFHSNNCLNYFREHNCYRCGVEEYFAQMPFKRENNCRYLITRREMALEEEPPF